MTGTTNGSRGANNLLPTLLQEMDDEIHITVVVDSVETISITLDLDDTDSDFTKNYYYWEK